MRFVAWFSFAAVILWIGILNIAVRAENTAATVVCLIAIAGNAAIVAIAYLYLTHPANTPTKQKEM